MDISGELHLDVVSTRVCVGGGRLGHHQPPLPLSLGILTHMSSSPIVIPIHAQDHDIYKQRLSATGQALNGPLKHDVTATKTTAILSGNSSCGSCYGAEDTVGQCCNTCDEVRGPTPLGGGCVGAGAWAELGQGPMTSGRVGGCSIPSQSFLKSAASGA